MNYLTICLNVLLFYNISALKIKIGQNIDKFIFDEWENSREKNYEYFKLMNPDTKKKLYMKKIYFYY